MCCLLHISGEFFVALKMQEKDLEVDYEIGVVLGNGGFGTVYAGTRRKDGKRVCIVRFALTALNCFLCEKLDSYRLSTNLL